MPSPTPATTVLPPGVGPGEWSGTLRVQNDSIPVTGYYYSWMAESSDLQCEASEYVGFFGQRFTFEILMPLGTGNISDETISWDLPIVEDEGQFATGRIPQSRIILLPGPIYPDMSEPPQLGVVGGTLHAVSSRDEAVWAIDIDADLACYVDVANNVQCVEDPAISIDLAVAGTSFSGLSSCVWEADPSVTYPGPSGEPLCARRFSECAP